eukprot:PRCOL_00006577-RA
MAGGGALVLEADSQKHGAGTSGTAGSGGAAPSTAKRRRRVRPRPYIDDGDASSAGVLLEASPEKGRAAVGPCSARAGPPAAAHKPPLIRRLKVLTFNMWGDARGAGTQLRRAAAAVALLGELCPDVICMQEPYPALLHAIGEAAWYEGYALAHPKVHTRFARDGGNVMLVRKRLRILDVDTVPFFNTRSGRAALVAKLDIGAGMHVWVGATHLESPDVRGGRWFKEERCSQLTQALCALDSLWTEDAEACAGLILCGDMNWGDARFEDGDFSTKDGAMPLTRGWFDAWPVLKASSGERGFTYDTRRNKMLADWLGAEGGLRLDRCVARLDGDVLRASAIDLVGDSAVPGEYCVRMAGGKNATDVARPLFISDHFGLITTFATASAREECTTPPDADTDEELELRLRSP